MHRAALVASFTAVSIRMASSGSISSAWGTRSTPLVPGMRMSHSMSDTRWRRSCCRASSPDPAAYTSNCCWARNFLRALRIGSSSSTTSTWTGPVLSATMVLLPLTFHERDFHRPREQARALRPPQQLGHRPTPVRAVVDGVRVHVHPDEPVGAGVIESAAESLRVREGLRAVPQSVLDARFQVARDVAHQRGTEVTPHHIAAEGERQAVGLLVPPLAHIDPQVETAVAVRELSFVDQEAGVRPPRRYVILDLIERDDDVPCGGLIELERQEGGRELARYRHERASPRRQGAAGVGRSRSARHDAGPVAVADARAVREQRVPVGEVRIRV